ncbi:MAG: EF-P lysine aminoacylase GenX [Planctomycetes bacterium]|nr:EF-P lysine aminoacylase GenX [Planctomycetota bacterium]
MPTRPILELRAGLRGRLRSLFDSRGFVEVDTPVLSSEVLPEAHIDPLAVHLDGHCSPPHYLQASPEAHMKRLLATGSGPIYQFARSFRAGERGTRHDVEFVLLEWYAPGTTLDDTAALLAELCTAALGTNGLERVTCREAFAALVGIDPLGATLAEWRDAGKRTELALPQGHPDSCDAWFELVLAEVVSPKLGHGRPTMLEAWPPSQAAFGRLDDASPPTARRFELFSAGVELANGWEEETRREILLERIATANALRARDDRPALPVPARLVEAHGPAMPAGVGAALGFDRLAMLAAGAPSIDAVRCFTSRTA